MYRNFHRRSRMRIKSAPSIKSNVQVPLTDESKELYMDITRVGMEVTQYIYQKTGRAMIMDNAANFKNKLVTWSQELERLKGPFLKHISENKGWDGEKKKFVAETIDYFVEALRQTAVRKTDPDLILAFVSGSDDIIDELHQAIKDFARIFHGKLNKNNNGELINQIDIDFDKSLYELRDNPRLLSEKIGADWVLQFSDSQKPQKPKIDDTIDSILNNVQRNIPDKKDQEKIAEVVDKTPLQERQERFVQLLMNLKETGDVSGQVESSSSSESSTLSGSKPDDLTKFDTVTPNSGDWNRFLDKVAEAVLNDNSSQGVAFSFRIFYRDNNDDKKEIKPSKDFLFNNKDSIDYGNITRLFRDIPDDIKDRPSALEVSFGNNDESILVDYSDLGKIAGHLQAKLKEVEKEIVEEEKEQETSSTSSSSSDDNNLPKVDKNELPRINPMEIGKFTNPIKEELSKANDEDDFYDRLGDLDGEFFALIFNNQGKMTEYPLMKGNFEELVKGMERSYSSKRQTVFSGRTLEDNYGDRTPLRLGLRMLGNEYYFVPNNIKPTADALVNAQLEVYDSLEDEGARSVYLKKKALEHAYRMYKEMLFK